MLVRVYRGHVSKQMNISTEWVLMLQKSVAVCILGNMASLAWLLILLVLGHDGIRVPANLLSCRLLPFWALAWHTLCRTDTFLHWFDFENAVDSSWIIRHVFVCCSLRSFETFQCMRVLRIRMSGLLGYEFDCQIFYHKLALIFNIFLISTYASLGSRQSHRCDSSSNVSPQPWFSHCLSTI